jgi:hypothetical protein
VAKTPISLKLNNSPLRLALPRKWRNKKISRPKVSFRPTGCVKRCGIFLGRFFEKLTAQNAPQVTIAYQGEVRAFLFSSDIKFSEFLHGLGQLRTYINVLLSNNVSILKAMMPNVSIMLVE